MKISIPTYLNKEYIIEDNFAVIRNPKNLERSLKYKAGDLIPPNSGIGKTKIIPLNTKVKITEVKMDEDRNVYIFAVPIDAPDYVLAGWTRPLNLLGRFLNEIIAYKPKEWELEPGENNYTVVDNFSLIRSGSPNYRSTGKIIPVGAYVEVTARSNQPGKAGKFVRVRHISIEDGKLIAGEPIGWTAASNLVDGNAKVFATAEWEDPVGDNAAWKSGKFIGAKVLVGIVGTGGQLQYIDLNTLDPYLKLMEAAQKDNITLSINSGFRTFAKQKRLRDGWEARIPGFNLAAKPGRSNHQNGIAFDLNTGNFGLPVYEWLKKHGTAYGFIRTVNKEHWHWEYRPKDAAKARKNKRCKLARVKK